mmetsp:Transcript_84952/g.245639  ORF Transcript_84952/g.245639 Transcript_84952/m.245639 type:complete len:270 (+) Transcript_84952:138-947(+)
MASPPRTPPPRSPVGRARPSSRQTVDSALVQRPTSSGSSAQMARSMARSAGEVAQLALLARLHGLGEEAVKQKRRIVKGTEATDLVVWALEVNERGPTCAVDSRAPPVRVNRFARRFCACLVAFFAYVALLALLRGHYRELAAQGDILLASGTPAYAGEEPVATVGAALHRHSLVDCAALPAAALQGARDISLVHQGTWHNLRIVHLQKFSDSHMWLQAADGTGVRIKHGQIYLRRGRLGDEEHVAPDEAMSPEAAAYFEALALSDRAF